MQSPSGGKVRGAGSYQLRDLAEWAPASLGHGWPLDRREENSEGRAQAQVTQQGGGQPSNEGVGPGTKDKIPGAPDPRVLAEVKLEKEKLAPNPQTRQVPGTGQVPTGLT